MNKPDEKIAIVAAERKVAVKLRSRRALQSRIQVARYGSDIFVIPAKAGVA